MWEGVRAVKSGQRFLHILYTWLVIGAGFYALSHFFSDLDFDQGREFLALAALGVLAWWLAVSFPRGILSGVYSVVLASFLIYGPAAAAWISLVAVLVGQGVANRGNPLRTTFFNAGQYVLAIWGADYVFSMAGGVSGKPLDPGAVWPIAAFTLSYFLINHLVVYFYLVPKERRHNIDTWRDALRWDGLTYLFTAPFGVVMALLYPGTGLAGILLLFVPVLVVQFILRMYVHVELVNRELTALYNVARRLSGKMSTEQIVDMLLKESRRAMAFHTGIVYLWSETGRHYVARGAYGPYANQLRGSQMSPGEGFLGSVMEGREPVIIEDVKNDPELRREPGLFQVHRSLLIIPLLAENEVLGVIVLGDKRPNVFSEDHLHMLSIISGQAAVTLANNLLFRRLETGAVTDGLTGVFNRHYFFNKVQEEFARAESEGENLAVITLDLDGLKYINDRFGYHSGDVVLVETANLLCEMAGPTGTVARSDGEEFCILLPGADKEQTTRLAEDIRNAVREHYFRVDGLPRQIRVSVGAAVFPEDAKNSVHLMQKADRALLRAKQGGKDRVVVANS